MTDTRSLRSRKRGGVQIWTGPRSSILCDPTRSFSANRPVDPAGPVENAKKRVSHKVLGRRERMRRPQAQQALLLVSINLN